MKKYYGKSIDNKIAIGQVKVWNPKSSEVLSSTNHGIDVDVELNKVKRAVDAVQQMLDELYDKAVMSVGEKTAFIFEVHKLILCGDDYQSSIASLIKKDKLSASAAVQKTGEEYAGKLLMLDDEEMKARAADVTDVTERLLEALEKDKAGAFGAEAMKISADDKGMNIIIAHDISPSQLMSMDHGNIAGMVTTTGSVNSHFAILARMLNIPTIVGCDIQIDEIINGSEAIVDGMNNELIINPDAYAVDDAAKRMSISAQSRARLESLKGEKTITKDGREIAVYANIAVSEDVDSVIANDAEGIGLFRSEFIYMNRETAPSEDEQFEAYKRVALKMMGKRVTVRTFDIGADKEVPYLNIPSEPNPALGYRAIRIGLKEEQLLITQLKALMRAAVYGNLAVMYPMIISEKEIFRIQEICDKAKHELDSEGREYKLLPQGVMIETPAAVLIADRLARHVEFFSIGTNDLAQYTLALDRQQEDLDIYFDPHHPAMLHMIKMTVDSAHRHGVRVAICGEMASDTELTEKFLDMGVDELSVKPDMVLEIREKVRSIDIDGPDQNGKYKCMCCGGYTLDNPHGCHDICEVCSWEDDKVQTRDTEFAGGANRVSLNTARDNFLRFGACEETYIK